MRFSSCWVGIFLHVPCMYAQPSCLWTYDHPDAWHALCADSSCADQRQSPINIDFSNVVNERLKSVQFSGYDRSLEELEMVNSRHTVVLKFTQNSDIYISGGPLPIACYLIQMHFHWGTSNDKGSEHTFAGKSYPMELHMVHWSKTGKTKAVVAVLFQISETANEALQPLLDLFHAIRYADQTAILPDPFSPSSLLPVNRDSFLTYKGSLTTPPCTENINWIILNDTVDISKDQLAQFRKLSSSKFGQNFKSIAPNYRPVQVLGNRTVRQRLVNKHLSLEDNVLGVHTTSAFPVAVYVIAGILGVGSALSCAAIIVMQRRTKSHYSHV